MAIVTRRSAGYPLACGRNLSLRGGAGDDRTYTFGTLCQSATVSVILQLDSVLVFDLHERGCPDSGGRPGEF